MSSKYTLRPGKQAEWLDFVSMFNKRHSTGAIKKQINGHTKKRIEKREPVYGATIRGMAEAFDEAFVGMYPNFIEYFFESERERQQSLHIRFKQEVREVEAIGEKHPEILIHFYGNQTLDGDPETTGLVLQAAIRVLNLHDEITRCKDKLYETDYRKWLERSIVPLYRRSPIYRQILTEDPVYETLHEEIRRYLQDFESEHGVSLNNLGVSAQPLEKVH